MSDKSELSTSLQQTYDQIMSIPTQSPYSPGEPVQAPQQTLSPPLPTPAEPAVATQAPAPAVATPHVSTMSADGEKPQHIGVFMPPVQERREFSYYGLFKLIVSVIITFFVVYSFLWFKFV